MLLNDFFTIQEVEASDKEVKTLLVINAAHKIFEGHFPGQPVVPGVCMMQMVKEILEQVLGRETDLVKASEMKFLAVLNPKENNLVHATIKYVADEDGKIKINASIFKDELVYFKCKTELEFLTKPKDMDHH